MSIIHREQWDAGSFPADWTVAANYGRTSSPSGFTPISSPNVLSFTTSSNGSYGAWWNTPDGNSGNVAVSAYAGVFAAAGRPMRMGVLARSNNTSTSFSGTNCYAGWVDWQNSLAGISIFSGGVETTLFSVAAPPQTGWVWPYFHLNGTALGLAVRRQSDGFWLQPGGTYASGAQVDCVSGTDGTYSGSGFAGLCTIQYGSGFAGYSDDWQLDTYPPPASPTPAVRVWMPPLPEGPAPFVVPPRLPDPQYRGTPAPRPPIWPVRVPGYDPEPWAWRIPGVPSPQYAGPPPPRPAVTLPPPNAFAPPDPWAWRPQGLPWAFEAFRPGIPTHVIHWPAPAQQWAPASFTPRRLPSAGTPTPLAIAPPGPARVAYGLADAPPPSVPTARRLPSVGTPAPLPIGPPGPQPVIYGLAQDPPPVAWTPRRLPSIGTPGSTGPGLMVAPNRIARGWANRGQGGVGGWGSGWGGAGAGWGDGGWGDAGRCDVSPSTYGADGPGTQGSGRLVAGSSNPGGGFMLGSPGCCCDCRITICVTACGGVPAFGAQVGILKDGTLLASCTTGPSGCCTFTTVPPGSYTIQVTYNGVVVFSQSRTLSCGGTVGVGLGNNTGLVCCGGYAIPTHLTLTDAAGTLDFVYDPNSFFPIWYGGHDVQQRSCTVTTPFNVCVVAPASNGPVKVCYQMVCFAGQTPHFSVQRSWSWVYEQGTLTPIYFQDNSGTTPGLPCVTSPPAICGSPLTDTAGFTADPSSPSPFVLTGSPVAAAANSTADPVGGGVVISA